MSKTGVKRWTQSYDGARIAFTDYQGTGPTYLFLPGWCCTQRSWAVIAEELPRDMRAVTLDYAGFGASASHDRQWAISNLARDARAVIEALDLRDVIVVGHSMGGAVALELGYLAPDRIRCVVGADTFTYRAFYYAFDERQVDAAMAPLRADFSRSVRELIGAYFLPSPDSTLRAQIADEMAAADGPTACGVLENFLRWDVRASLSRYGRPVQAINASHFFDAQAADELGLEVALMDGVGHFLMLEKPAIFLENLLRMTSSPDVAGHISRSSQDT